jgi:peptidoglycan-N-acetylglucosamine deacetylase
VSDHLARRLAAGLALGMGSAALGLPELAPVFSPGRSLLHIADRLADPTKVALTFDDGPHPEATPRVLDFLSRHDLSATFFLVAEQVALRPDLAAEIARRGHAVGVHGYSHRTLVRLDEQQLDGDLERAARLISAVTGRTLALYRPPRGMFTYSGLATVRRRGWEPVLWAADGRDWRSSATPASICRRVTSGLRGGEVILLHDADHYAAQESWRNTVAALPLIVRELRARGLEPVRL